MSWSCDCGCKCGTCKKKACKCPCHIALDKLSRSGLAKLIDEYDVPVATTASNNKIFKAFVKSKKTSRILTSAKRMISCKDSKQKKKKPKKKSCKKSYTDDT